MSRPIRYTVHCEPTSHLYHITMRITAFEGPRVEVSLPAWTPGSYLVREYSRHLQNFRCVLPWEKINKNTWHIHVPTTTTEIVIEYSIYGYDLSVRTSHLDTTHGYFNGACLFLMYGPARQQLHELYLVPPNNHWQITTSLRAEADYFVAQTFDELVDSPVEMGTHELHNFMVLDKVHQLAIWGKGNYNSSLLVQDIQHIIETVAALFGGLPYTNYLFILHCGDSYGGLEHKDSTTLLFPRLQFQPTEKYEKFLQLVAHEFFHAWNIKRLRPETLDNFNYNQENYVSVLWFCEGATAYYDELLCYRAGFYNEKRYLNLLSDAITRLENTPGKEVQSLTQSSFDAWIKLYRPDENTNNSSVSYYLKGQIIIWLLDLIIRTHSTHSFDTVFQRLWQNYQQSGGKAYSEADLWRVIEAVAGIDLTDFYKKYLTGTTPIPYQDFLTPFGLQLKLQQDAYPYTGLRLGEDKAIIKFVETNSPAQRSGLAPGDELVALEGYRVTPKNWLELTNLKPAVTVTYFRRDELLESALTFGATRPNRYSLHPMTEATPQQRERYERWLESP